MTDRFVCVATLALGVAVLTACATEDMAFRIDDRVSIVTPEDGEEVSLPLTITWTATDVEDVDSYGVYVDATPIGPGEAFSLREGEAYRTPDTTIVIEQLPFDTRDDDDHVATIVLLDEAGERMGESAFEVEFEVRGATSG